MDGGETPPEDYKPQGTIKTIASPRLMSKLSPVSQYVASQGINVNPLSQKHLLKYAKKGGEREKKEVDSDNSDDENDYSKF